MENCFVAGDELIDARRAEIERRADDIADYLDRHPIEKSESLHISMLNVRPPNMALSYTCRNNRALFAKLNGLKRRLYPELTETVAPSADPEKRRSAPLSRGRIRVAFVAERLSRFSSVLRDRMGVAANLPSSHFHVTAVMFSPPSDDAASKYLAAGVDRILVLPGNPLAHIPFLAAVGFDAIVYAEIGLVGATHFLPFNRLAPLQLTTWGHSDTSGIDTVDLYVTSEWFEEAAAADHYTERLVRQKSLSTHYFRTSGPPTPAGVAASRASFGLPATGNMYLLMQTLGKLHAAMAEEIRAVLVHDPAGFVVITGANDEGEQGEFYRALELYLESETCTCSECAEAAGATGGRRLIERVRLLPFQPFYRGSQLLTLASVMLDGYAFGGCNTTLEAIENSTILVTCPTDFLHGRFSAGYLRRLHLEELIGTTPADTGRLATEIALDPERVRRLTIALEHRRHVLYNDDDALREWTDLLLEETKPFTRRAHHDVVMGEALAVVQEICRRAGAGAWPTNGTLLSLVRDKAFPTNVRGATPWTIPERDYAAAARTDARAVAWAMWDRLDVAVNPPADPASLRKHFLAAGWEIVAEHGAPSHGWLVDLFVGEIPVRIHVVQISPKETGRPGSWTAHYGADPALLRTGGAQQRRHYHDTFKLGACSFPMREGGSLPTVAPTDCKKYLAERYGPKWTVADPAWSPASAPNLIASAAFVAGRFDSIDPTALALFREMSDAADAVGVCVYSDSTCAIGGKACKTPESQRLAAVQRALSRVPAQCFVFICNTRTPDSVLIDRAELSDFRAVGGASGIAPSLLYFAAPGANIGAAIRDSFEIRRSPKVIPPQWLTATEVHKAVAAPAAPAEPVAAPVAPAAPAAPVAAPAESVTISASTDEVTPEIAKSVRFADDNIDDLVSIGSI